MKTVPLGASGLDVSNLMLGLMRIADKSDEEIRTLFDTARESGITVFDHAAVYGERQHHCEERFAQALQLSPTERSQIVLQTKAGIARGGPYDSSYDHIVTSVEESLAALHTDYLDVLLLHRPDSLVEPDEVARAFDDLEASGKVRSFGVSNHTAGQIALLKTAVRQPIVANQVQLSLTHAPIIVQGLASNMVGVAQSTVLDGGGLLDYCRINHITLQAWSPFQAGFFTGTFLGSSDYPELNALIDQLAATYDVPTIAIATAWITRHPAGMQVVLGTTNPDRITGAAKGSDLPLTRTEWYDLVRAAGYIAP